MLKITELPTIMYFSFTEIISRIINGKTVLFDDNTKFYYLDEFVVEKDNNKEIMTKDEFERRLMYHVLHYKAKWDS